MNYTEKTDQEADKDYQLLIKRLIIVGILAMLAFGAVKFHDKFNLTGKIEDQFEDVIDVYTNDAVASKIRITYHFTIDLDKLDVYTYQMFKNDHQLYYKKIFHFTTANAIKTKALKMNYEQPNILHNYMKMVEECVHGNLPKEISLIDLVTTIDHNPKVLEHLKRREEAAQNALDAEKIVNEAKVDLEELIREADKKAINEILKEKSKNGN